MLGTIGGILGGLGQLAGGAAGLFGGGGGGTDWTSIQVMREQQQRNEQLQREFAQNGIRWKVEDAKAAGLHPLAAIGAMGTSYSPTIMAAGGDRPSSGSNIGSSLANMGQGIGRAISATQTKEEKVETAFDLVTKSQQIERGDLQNKLLAAQLALIQTGSGPGMPRHVKTGSGQGWEYKDAEVTPTGRPGVTAAPPEANPLGTDYVDPHGGRTTLPQKNVNIDEVSSPGWASFMYTNRLLPFVDQIAGRRSPAMPPDKDLPPGATGWHFAFPGRWIPVWKNPPRGQSGHGYDHRQTYFGGGY